MAARALEEAFAVHAPGVDVCNIDALEYTTFLHRNVYAQSYLSMVNYLPSVWGYFYDRFEKKDSRPMARVLAWLDRLNANGLFKMIAEYKPDHIISTHFLPAELIDMRGLRVSNSVVITDYDAHSMWAYENVGRYFVATDETRHSLVHNGVDAEKVVVSGIPVRQAFLRRMGRAALQKKWKVDAKVRTILLMSGGYGVGRVEEIVSTLLGVAGAFNLLVVVGNNKQLERRLTRLGEGVPPRVKYQVFGFVQDIAELMEISDLAISKAGGLTMTECLVKGLPLIVTDPIPGQEDRNADYLLEMGAGFKAHSLVNLEGKVARLLGNPRLLSQVRLAALAAARPDAAEVIVKKVMAG